jgi:hypothetical protein
MAGAMTSIEKQLMAEWEAAGARRPDYSESEFAAMTERFKEIYLEAERLGVKTEWTDEDLEKVQVVSRRVSGKIQAGMEKLSSNDSVSRRRFTDDPIEYFGLAEDIPPDHRSMAGSILREAVGGAADESSECQYCIASVLGVMMAVIAVFAIVAAIAAAILAFPFWPSSPLVSVIAALSAAIAVLIISIGILDLCQLITLSGSWQDLARKVCHYGHRC